MKSEKIKQFLIRISAQKDSLMLLCVSFLTMLIFAYFIPSISNQVISIIVFLFTIYCIKSPIDDCFCVLIFSWCFIFFQIELFGLSWFTWCLLIFLLVFAVKYFCGVLCKKKKLLIAPLLLSICMTLWLFVNFNVANFNMLFAPIFLLGAAYLMFVESKNINFNKISYYFLFGILISCAVGCVFMTIPSIYPIIYGKFNRFQALMTNPNGLQLLIVIMLAIVIMHFFKNNLNWKLFIPLSGFLVVMGIMTKSKAFLISCVILIIIFMVLLIVKYKIKGLLFSILGITCIFLGCVIFKDQIKEIIKRFTIGYVAENPLDVLFTGRWSIWTEYLGVWTSSVLNILFGCGLTVSKAHSLNPHSSYIDFLYNYGVVGVVLLISLILSYLKLVKFKTQRLHFTNLIPIMSAFWIALEETILIQGGIMFILVLGFVFDKCHYSKNTFTDDKIMMTTNVVKRYKRVKKELTYEKSNVSIRN